MPLLGFILNADYDVFSTYLFLTYLFVKDTTLCIVVFVWYNNPYYNHSMMLYKYKSIQMYITIYPTNSTFYCLYILNYCRFNSNNVVLKHVIAMRVYNTKCNMYFAWPNALHILLRWKYLSTRLVLPVHERFSNTYSR